MVDNRTVLKPSTTPFWGPTAGLVGGKAVVDGIDSQRLVTGISCGSADASAFISSKFSRSYVILLLDPLRPFRVPTGVTYTQTRKVCYFLKRCKLQPRSERGYCFVRKFLRKNRRVF